MSNDKLPKGWTRVKFGDVVRKVSDRVDPDTADIERYVAGEHMDTDHLTIRRWGKVGDGYLGPAFHMRFRPGQVLYGSRRTYLRKVAVADFEGITANTTFVIEPSSKILLPEFMPLVMTTEAFHEHSIKQSKGSVNPYINFSDLTWYEFALPPLEEQQKIVEMLVASGAVEQAERKAFEASVSEVSALLRSMTEVGEPTTLGALAGGGIQIGPFGSQLHVSDYAVDGVPVLMPADLRQRGLDTSEIRYVDESKAQELSSHRLREGDIVLPRRGELDKRAIISAAEAGWLCGTGSVRVRLQDPTLAPLVLDVLASRESVQWLSENAVGTTMPNINRDIVARIPLRLPPQESRALWVKRLSTARSVSEALMASLGKSARRAASLREALLEVDRVQ